MSEESFTGTRRYTPTRVMGAGSWGRVYQAYDNERNAFVAVKLLQRGEPRRAAPLQARVPFSARRRSSQPGDVVRALIRRRPVVLHHGAGRREELPRARARRPRAAGGPVLSPPAAPRPPSTSGAGGASMHVTTATVEGKELKAPSPRRRPRRWPPAAWLPGPKRSPGCAPRSASSSTALAALHDAGKLHRDIKPSNVLVEPGRPGGAARLRPGHELIGAVDEQLASGRRSARRRTWRPSRRWASPLDAATDWYAVGVHALRGAHRRGAVRGAATQMMRCAAPSTRRGRARRDGVPDDLDGAVPRCSRATPRPAPPRACAAHRAARRPRAEGAARPARAADSVARPSSTRCARRAPGQGEKPPRSSSRPSRAWARRALVAHVPRRLEDGRRRRWCSRPLLRARVGAVQGVRRRDRRARRAPRRAAARGAEALLPRDVRSLMRLFPTLAARRGRSAADRLAVPVDLLEVRRRGVRGAAAAGARARPPVHRGAGARRSALQRRRQRRAPREAARGSGPADADARHVPRAGRRHPGARRRGARAGGGRVRGRGHARGAADPGGARAAGRRAGAAARRAHAPAAEEESGRVEAIVREAKGNPLFDRPAVGGRRRGRTRRSPTG